MSQVMGVSQPVASPALTIVADADHRASRTSELFEALQAVAPSWIPCTTWPALARLWVT